MRPSVTLTGGSLRVEDVVAVAAQHAHVVVADEARQRATGAAELLRQIAARSPVYGRTTGVGANRTIVVSPGERDQHGMRLLRSHAAAAGERLPEAAARALMVIRANQLLAGGAGTSPHLADALVEALNQGAYPAVHAIGALGTGDLTALSETALTLAGERSWLGAAAPPPVRIDSSDALAFISSNAATIGQAVLAFSALQALLVETPVVAALTLLAVDGSAEAYAPEVHALRPHPGSVAVAQRMRELVGPGGTSARIQDPYGLRCLPQVLGPAMDALDALRRVLVVDINAAAENPLVVDGANKVFHHGGFHSQGLALALDQLRLGVLGVAQLSAARLGLLLEPSFTSLEPFLADGPPGSSGVLILEYTAHSALAALRNDAVPPSLGHAVLSRGVEEHASFASQSAGQTLAAVGHLRIALACELLAAVRAVRQRGLAEAGSAELRAQFSSFAAALPDDHGDRDLGPDLAVALSLLGGPAAADADPPGPRTLTVVQ